MLGPLVTDLGEGRVGLPDPADFLRQRSALGQLGLRRFPRAPQAGVFGLRALKFANGALFDVLQPVLLVRVGARFGPRDLRDPRKQLADLLGLRLDLPAALPAALDEPALDLAEPLGAEQFLQQLLAFRGVRAQELGELALRQHHDLEELLDGHPQQPPHRATDLVDARQAFRRELGGGSIDPGQGCLRRLRRVAVAALLRPLVLRAACQPQPLPLHRQFQHDLGGGLGFRRVATEPFDVAARARHRAVERESDGVQQRGLARAGVAVQQEETIGAEPIEVHPLVVAVRTERTELQVVQSHLVPSVAATARSASSSSARSDSLGSAPRQSATNVAVKAWSSRPRTISA